MHHVHTCTCACVFVHVYVFLVQVCTCILLKMELKTWGEEKFPEFNCNDKTNWTLIMWTTICIPITKRRPYLHIVKSMHKEIILNVKLDTIDKEGKYFQRSWDAHRFPMKFWNLTEELFSFFYFLFFYLSASLIEMHRSRGPKKFKPQANSNKVKPQRNTN